MNEILTSSTVSADSIRRQAGFIQSTAKDFTIDEISQEISMNSRGNLVFKGGEMPMSSWSLNQLGYRIGVPGLYLQNCMDRKMTDLAALNVNRWIQDKPHGGALIRTVGVRPHVRGFLSKKYTSFDMPDILDEVLPLIPEGKWDIKGSYIDEEKMHLRFVSNDKIKVENDEVFPAIFITSSDVGQSAVNIQLGLYRLVCTNGLIIAGVATEYVKRHVGISREGLAMSTRLVLENIPFMIGNAEAMIRRASEKRTNLLFAEDIEAMARFLQANRISKADSRAILKINLEKYPHTKWGMVNSITEFAQSVKTIDGRMELEKAAGKILAAA